MRSERVERANEGLMRCGRAVIGRHIVVADGDARSYGLPSAKGTLEEYQLTGLTFLIRFVASIKTSVSERKLWTAARYPMRF